MRGGVFDEKTKIMSEDVDPTDMISDTKHFTEGFERCTTLVPFLFKESVVGQKHLSDEITVKHVVVINKHGVVRSKYTILRLVNINTRSVVI